MFQSTHPRGVRHTDDANLRIYLDVSIHAPTRGATYEYHRYLGKCKVSIHAPTRGATLLIYFSGCNFKVSIHAPTRGATSWTVANTSRSGFQSTHPRGVRRGIGYVPRYYDWFQSTHPRGVRRIALVIQRVNKIVSIHAPTRGATDWRSSLWRAVSFNPRTHEGCDFPKYRSNHTILVSIHAPTRGATRVSPARRSCQRVSIHAPTRGAT